MSDAIVDQLDELRGLIEALLLRIEALEEPRPRTLGEHVSAVLEKGRKRDRNANALER